MYHPNKIIPLVKPGEIGRFYYDAKKDLAAHDAVQNKIFYLVNNAAGEKVTFDHVLSKVDTKYQTKFQEMALSTSSESKIETAPFLLTNGLMVVDFYNKFLDEDGKLDYIIGATQVIKNLAV